MLDSHPLPQIPENLRTLLPLGSAHGALKATVSDTIHPNDIGRVKFLGTWWFAMCEQNVTLTPGMTVYVLDREGLTLIVEPVDPLIAPPN